VGHFDTELSLAATAPLQLLGHSVTTPPMLVISSDLRRCASSAALLARAWHSELRFDPRLRELSFGDWEGRLWSEIAETDRDALDAWGRDWTQHSPPSGETGAVFAARVQSVLDDILPLAEHTSAELAIVSHAGWIRVATTLLLRQPLSSAFDRSIDYAHAAVFSVRKACATLDAWDVDQISDADARPLAPQSVPL
jgi:broad specificity phosphatase PhoE